MRGFPKHVNTRRDIELLMGFLGTDKATAENLRKGLDVLNGLLHTTRFVFDRELAVDEPLDGPAPEYVLRYGENDERLQFRLEEDPNAKLYRLGLTKAEVQEWADKLEQALAG